MQARCRLAREPARHTLGSSARVNGCGSCGCGMLTSTRQVYHTLGSSARVKAHTMRSAAKLLRSAAEPLVCAALAWEAVATPPPVALPAAPPSPTPPLPPPLPPPPECRTKSTSLASAPSRRVTSASSSYPTWEGSGGGGGGGGVAAVVWGYLTQWVGARAPSKVGPYAWCGLGVRCAGRGVVQNTNKPGASARRAPRPCGSGPTCAANPWPSASRARRSVSR